MRIRSKQSDFNENCEQFHEALIQQEYPRRIVDDAVKRAGALNRKDFFHAKRNNQFRHKVILSYHTAHGLKMVLQFFIKKLSTY